MKYENRLVVGTTTPEIKPGGIPSFLTAAKNQPRYQFSVFVEWCAHESERQVSLGRFERNRFMRTLVSQLIVLRLAHKFNEIEVHSIRTGFTLLMFYRRKCIFFYHGPAFQEAAVEGAGPTTRLLLYFIENTLLSGLKGYKTASEAFRTRLRENHGVSFEKIEVVRPELAIDRPAYTKQLAAALDQARTTGVIQCVICRRLVQRVGILEFLDKLAQVPERQDILVTIVGQGPLEDEVREAAQRDARIAFLGSVPDNIRDEIYTKAIFNIVPTLHLEGLGMVIYEGAKFGAIPVVTNCGGMPELLDEIRIGKYFTGVTALIEGLTLEAAETDLARQIEAGAVLDAAERGPNND